MSCDIYIRSYYKDFRWLSFCLRSIENYCTGFRKVMIVVPQASRERMDRVPDGGAEIRTCPDFRDDYLGQQVSKLFADEYTDAEFICHVDSDCIFHQPCSPEHLFADHRPEIWMTPYAEFRWPGPWQRSTERFLGCSVEYNFMRRQPQLYPRWLYGALRDHALGLHGLPLDRYVTAQGPRGFSEFNALGAYAFLHHKDQFSWRQTHPEDSPNNMCTSYWSWGGTDQLAKCGAPPAVAS